jgi:hypothetical protein
MAAHRFFEGVRAPSVFITSATKEFNMNLSHLENTDAETVKSATAVLRRARRRYIAAVARIRRVETFLEKNIAGLGYESRHLYGEMEPFDCPPEPVIVGLTRRMPQSFNIFFANRDGEWHFFVAPMTSNPEGPTLTMSEALPLVSAPAEVVLSRVEFIERYAVEILEHIATVVAVSSGDEAAFAQPKPIAGKKVTEEPPKRTVH